LAQLIPEQDRIWADPFPAFHDGHFYLFLEQQFAGKNGTLGFVEVRGDLSHSEFIPALEKDYHLSWPNVFRIGSTWYMIPETHEHKTIDLYRARRFPSQWELQGTLMDQVEAVDTALLFYRDKWWLFTSIAEKTSLNGSLSVFWSETFPSSDWKPLPGNPVVTGLSKSRMAGNLFIDAEGRLIRPAQNCAGEYGKQVTLYHVKNLSPEKYEEEAAAAVYPERELRAACTHTYNSSDQFLIRDIKTRRFRFVVNGTRSFPQ
jgi:hypothetical protein